MSEQRTIWFECDEAMHLRRRQRCSHGWVDGYHLAASAALLIEDPDAALIPLDWCWHCSAWTYRGASEHELHEREPSEFRLLRADVV